MARSEARCSIGWCVGPSSPSAIESCVNTKIDGLPHERGEPDRRSHVVGEDEEGSAERPQPAVHRQAVQDRPHRVLAHAEVQVASAGSPRENGRLSGQGVLFDPVRSAEPPTSSGMPRSQGVRGPLPDAFRVDSVASASNRGSVVVPSRAAARPRSRGPTPPRARARHRPTDRTGARQSCSSCSPRSTASAETRRARRRGSKKSPARASPSASSSARDLLGAERRAVRLGRVLLRRSCRTRCGCARRRATGDPSRPGLRDRIVAGPRGRSRRRRAGRAIRRPRTVVRRPR